MKYKPPLLLIVISMHKASEVLTIDDVIPVDTGARISVLVAVYSKVVLQAVEVAPTLRARMRSSAEHGPKLFSYSLCVRPRDDMQR